MGKLNILYRHRLKEYWVICFVTAVPQHMLNERAPTCWSLKQILLKFTSNSLFFTKGNHAGLVAESILEKDRSWQGQDEANSNCYQNSIYWQLWTNFVLSFGACAMCCLPRQQETTTESKMLFNTHHNIDTYRDTKTGVSLDKLCRSVTSRTTFTVSNWVNLVVLTVIVTLCIIKWMGCI